MITNLPVDAGDPGLISRSGRSPEVGNGSILAGDSHGHRSLMDYSPWGHRESHITEGMST